MIDICIPNRYGQLKYSKIKIYDSVIAGAWENLMLTMKTTMTPGYIDRHQLGDQLGSVSPLKIQHQCPIVVQKDKMLCYRHQPGLVFSFAVIESNID